MAVVLFFGNVEINIINVNLSKTSFNLKREEESQLADA
jgi:hypothetical protein